jgi:Ca2+-binding EF-hand superfamily protein
VFDKIKTFGKNLTTKVTADKLNSAWKKAGSPTDSEELKSFLIKHGVNTDTVDQVYQKLKITSEKTKDYTAELRSRFAKIKTDLTNLDKQAQQRIITYLQQQLGIA